MKKFLVLLLLLYPVSALAVTYEWTDQTGTVNFTEDLGKVPKKYRKRVKVLGADESGAPQVIESSEPDKGKAKDAGALKEKQGLSPKDEAAIRKEYSAAKANLQATQQEVSDLRARLADTSKMSRSEYLALQNTLKQSEFRLKNEAKKLELLRQEADKAGVSVEGK